MQIKRTLQSNQGVPRQELMNKKNVKIFFFWSRQICLRKTSDKILFSKDPDKKN